MGAMGLAATATSQLIGCVLNRLSMTATDSSMPASLRSLARGRGIQIGVAVAARPLREELVYAQTLGREFNMLTPENAMKFGVLNPDRNRYEADAIVQFSGINARQVHGHTLVWHEQVPS